jgi:hypothetical protein
MNLENKTNPDFNVAVVSTTIMNPNKAGRELAEEAVKKLGKQPDFFILFATIHYEECGGFKPLLESIWDVLSDKTLLIGGNASGFVTSEGCIVKGAVALAVSYQNMDITIGIGRGTKRNPKKAAIQCANMIKKDLKNRYKNKFLISNISGVAFPRVSGKGNVPIIKSRILAKIVMPILKISQKLFQKGLGREQEVFEELVKQLPDFHMLHGSSATGPVASNYQFFNREITTNSVICLAIETDLSFKLNFTHGQEKLDVNFKITKISKDRLVVKKLNNKPAFPEFLRLIKQIESSIDPEALITNLIQLPIGYYKNDKEVLRPLGIVLGDSISSMCKIEKDDIFVGYLSPDKLVDSTYDVLPSEKPVFSFMISSSIRQAILAYRIFEIQKKLKKYFEEVPFLLVYTVGEGIYIPNEDFYYLNNSLVSVNFLKK